jgi:glycosyltransferase involved in cell wall biosynthesis
MLPISAVFITYNEERDLPNALSSLSGIADEIVVVDSGSTDHTCEIARQAGARVISRAWTDFGDQKNFAAAAATNEWVLSVDADEVLSPGLRDALGAWKQCWAAQQQPEHNAYEVNRKTNFLGKWILHSGWYPEYHIRLYRRDRARFVGAIHETVRTDNAGERPGRLVGDLLHYTVRTLPEHHAKTDAFASRAAADMFARGRRRWRGGMWVGAPWTLLHKFVVQRGFLDGYNGALIAWSSARYVWEKYRRLGILVRGGELEQRAWPQADDR